MTVHELPGLNGSNPLDFLATLGLLLVANDEAPDQARLGWAATGGRFVPSLRAPWELQALAERVAQRVRRAGNQENDAAALKPLDRRVGGLKTRRKKLLTEVKKARKGLRGASGTDRGTLEDRLRAVRQRIDETNQEIRAAQDELACALGFGVAHLGDVIGVAETIFRVHARHALDSADQPWLARQLAALGSNGCISGDDSQIEPTPFSFSNGSSGQKLLKDFRELARATTAEKLLTSLCGGEVAEPAKGIRSLNWSPADLRSYAHAWRSPEDDTAMIDVGRNALAYLGLGLVPALPATSGIGAVAFPRRKHFIWPIWAPMLTPPVVGSLLARHWSPRERGALAPEDRVAIGVIAVLASDRTNPSGKRNFFAPSRPL